MGIAIISVIKYILLFSFVCQIQSLALNKTSDISCVNGVREGDHCNCFLGYKGLLCLEKNCNSLNNGISNNVTRDNTCICDDKWGGNFCSFCKNSYSCIQASKDNSSRCIEDFITYDKKYFDCDVIDEDVSRFFGSTTTMFCLRDNKTDYLNCNIEFWDNSTNVFDQTLSCVVNNCTLNTINNQTNYHCSSTACSCKSRVEGRCDEQISSILKNLQGESNVYCNELTKICSFKIKNLPFELLLKCTSKMCQTQEDIDRFRNQDSTPIINLNQKTRIAIIGSSMGIFFVWVLFIIFTNGWREYDSYRWFKKNINADSVIKVDFKNFSYENRSGLLKKKCLIRPFNMSLEKPFDDGKIIGIIGESGVGKTTLLKIIGGQNVTGFKKGSFQINEKSSTKFRSQVYYSPNERIFIPGLKVIEFLRYHANLSYYSVKKQFGDSNTIDEIILMLLDVFNMLKFKDRVLWHNESLSFGEYKRLSIVISFLSPRKIIILDEPTNGLDNINSDIVTKNLKVLALKTNKLIIYTIQRPTPENFKNHIDHLILMGEGGILCHGKKNSIAEILQRSSNSSLDQFNYDKSKDMVVNILDFIKFKTVLLKSRTNNSQDEKDDIEMPDVEIENGEYKGQRVVIDKESELFKNYSIYPFFNLNNSDTNLDDNEDENDKIPLMGTEGEVFQKDLIKLNRYNQQRSMIYEVALLMIINLKTNIRNPISHLKYYIYCSFVGMFLGVIYHQLDLSLTGSQNRIGCLFFTIIFVNVMSVFDLPNDFLRSKQMDLINLNFNCRGISILVSRIVYNIIIARILPITILGALAYPSVGLEPKIGNVAVFLITLYMSSTISELLVVLLGFFTTDISSLLAVYVSNILFNMLFSGLFYNLENMNIYLKVFTYLSHWKFATKIILINEFFSKNVFMLPEGFGLREKKKINGLVFLKNFGVKEDDFLESVIGISAYLLVLAVIVYIIKYFKGIYRNK